MTLAPRPGDEADANDALSCVQQRLHAARAGEQEKVDRRNGRFASQSRPRRLSCGLLSPLCLRGNCSDIVAGNSTAVHDDNDGDGVIDAGELLAVYQYDGLHRRIVKLLPDGEDYKRTDYYYNEAWQVLEERYDAAGSAQPRRVTRSVQRCRRPSQGSRSRHRCSCSCMTSRSPLRNRSG